MDIDRKAIMSIIYQYHPCGFKKVTKLLGIPHKIYVNAFSFAKRKYPRYISGVIKGISNLKYLKPSKWGHPTVFEIDY